MKHTPEPWNVYDSKPKQVRICRVGEERIDQGAIATFAASADAWRSILCVNALAGLNPEAVSDVVEAFKKLLQYEGLVVQYMGELGNMQAEQMTQDVFTAARAALAKLEEGQ